MHLWVEREFAHGPYSEQSASDTSCGRPCTKHFYDTEFQTDTLRERATVTRHAAAYCRGWQRPAMDLSYHLREKEK